MEATLEPGLCSLLVFNSLGFVILNDQYDYKNLKLNLISWSPSASSSTASVLFEAQVVDEKGRVGSGEKETGSSLGVPKNNFI